MPAVAKGLWCRCFQWSRVVTIRRSPDSGVALKDRIDMDWSRDKKDGSRDICAGKVETMNF